MKLLLSNTEQLLMVARPLTNFVTRKTGFLFVLLCFISCHQPDHSATKRFIVIDKKLEELAKKLNTKVATDVGGYTVDGIAVPKEKIEVRKVMWIDGQIGKGIVIEPAFEKNRFDSPTWYFIVLAWATKKPAGSVFNPFWKNELMQKVSLATIEKNIDSLVNRSLDSLKMIKPSDLKI